MKQDFLTQNARLNEAIRYAVAQHEGQLRKGSTRPYIVHPLETMTILMGMGADTDLMIAGLLHDTIEDTGTTRREIEEKFGADVAALVAGHSEDKEKSWQERKSAAIAHLRQADRRMKLLVMSDKVSNLRSMVLDQRELGEKLWERFNAPKERQKWYYTGILDALKELREDPDAAPVYREMEDIFHQLFGGAV